MNSKSWEELSPAQQLAHLNELEEAGERLKPKQKALKVRLEKELVKGGDYTESKKVSEKPQTNLYGKVSTAKVNPKAVRFIQTERDLLTERTNSLKAHSPELIVERLGSLNAVNDTSLIRAAVLALKDMDDETLISLIKETQLNMIGSGNRAE